MIKEMNIVTEYFSSNFKDLVPDGVYAIPMKTSKGNAYMKINIVNNTMSGEDNFELFLDENLTKSWYNE